MTTIGRYRVIDLLGTGGMGVVYRAADETLRRTVALKFLAAEFASDEDYRARLLREARITASMNHPNTCIVYEIGELDQSVTLPFDKRVLGPGTLFIAMEFIEGETLGARLERAGPLSVPDAIGIALQVIDGLAEAHARQIVHRDLKPQNVMITPSGRVKIVDFGLAKPIRSVQHANALISTSEMLSTEMGEGAVIGTCAYMSPEQAAGRPIDSRSDVFSFGTMLFQMLTGRLPFVGDTTNETMAKILEADPAPWPQARARAFDVFGRLVARCLRKKPAERYTDASEILEELREIQQTVLSNVAVVPWWPRAAAGFAILLLAAFAVTHSLSPSAKSDERAGTTSAPPSSPVQDEPSTAAPPSNTEESSTPPAIVKPPNPRPAAKPDQASSPPERVELDAPTQSVENASRIDRGALSLTSVPRASVSLDGNLTGVTPLTLDVEPGTHEVVFTGPDGLRWRGRIMVVAGEVSELHRDLNAAGSLSVVSDVWSNVSLDGGPSEQTPIHFDRVSAGLHTLRIFREGYVTQEIEIVIEEGRAFSQRLTLEKKP